MFHLLKQPLQRQLLPFQPAEIAAAVVAPTKKALQILALQQLRSWLQVDQQVLTAIDVVQALGNIHFDAPHQVGQGFDRIQAHHDVMTDWAVHQARQLPLHRLHTAVGHQRIELDAAEALGIDVAVAWDLGDRCGGAIHPHREDHIGAATGAVPAQHHHLPGPEASPTGKRVGQRRGLRQREGLICRAGWRRDQPAQRNRKNQATAETRHHSSNHRPIDGLR